MSGRGLPRGYIVLCGRPDRPLCADAHATVAGALFDSKLGVVGCPRHVEAEMEDAVRLGWQVVAYDVQPAAGVPACGCLDCAVTA